MPLTENERAHHYWIQKCDYVNQLLLGALYVCCHLEFKTTTELNADHIQSLNHVLNYKGLAFFLHLRFTCIALRWRESNDIH